MSHHNNKSNHNNQKDTDAIEVYAPDTKTLYAVPRNAVSHHGISTNSSDTKGRLLVCRSYCNAIEEGVRPSEVTACAMGNQCRFVHIDVPLSTIKGDIIHVHYVYRDEASCQYESLAAAIARETNATTGATKESIGGFNLMIYGPNNREPVERIPCARLLLTGGSRYAYDCATNPRRNNNGGFADQPRVCHCAHYYFTQTCNRGANCSFIHVISVDPTQKLESTKPANYRRRVAQLGQTEVPQLNNMSPQTQFHSNSPSTQNTPMTIGHTNGGSPNLSRQMGSNNSSPTLVNGGRPNGTPMTSAYSTAHANRNPNSPAMTRTGPKPLTGSPQPQMQMEVVVGNKGHVGNFAHHVNETSTPNGGYSSANGYTNSSPQQQHGNGNWAQQQQTSPYHSNPTNFQQQDYQQQQQQQQQYGNAPSTPSRIRAMYLPVPPPPPASGPSIGTSMLPMDDVVEAHGDGTYHQQQTPNNTYNCNAQPNFTMNPYSSEANYYANTNGQYGMGGNGMAPAPTSPMQQQQQQYANSNRASPLGTPSTAMHKSGNRYAHNPYAQSPVTMQAQV